MRRLSGRLGHGLRVALLGLLALTLLYLLWLFGWVLYWRQFNPDSTRFMAIRLAELQAKQPNAVLKKTWLPYERISIHLKRALIAAEDGKFVQHGGFDWDGIQYAMKKNEKKGRAVAGGSTISQQLAKNLFLSPERSLARKGEEAIITLMIEATWSKRRIFEVYLNVIEWGNGVFGAEAAARHYYGIGADRISAEQAARLAAMAPAPRYYDRNRNSAGLARKAEVVLTRMPSAQVP
jgi:monofunctional glycosyltransferase